VGLLDEFTVPVQLAAKEPANAKAVERYLHVWTPHLLLLDPEGRVAYEWNGYLPPTLYQAELQQAIGILRLRQHRYAEAAAIFEGVRDDHPRSHVADAAAYWAAVARYEASGQADGLQAGWGVLRSRYPESVWRTKVLLYE
jgi:hypothetical protein